MATLGYFDRTGDQQVRDSLIGNGRSVASTQLNQGNRAIQNQAFSMAASQRGGNPALAMRNAQNAAAAAGVEHNYNQAKLRAQEQLQYQNIAQAEDAKRGQVIGGVLGGIGAGLGSLAGPAGTALGGAAGAALGKVANSAVSSSPVDTKSLAHSLAGGVANAGLGAATTPAAVQAAAPQAAAAAAPVVAAAAPAQPATPPLQTGMLPPTAAPQAQVSPMTPPPMQQVAVNNAPMPEGQAVQPQGPSGGYVPAAQIAQTMAPAPAPFNPQAQPVGPTPNYAPVQGPRAVERPGVAMGPISAPAVPPAFNPPQLATGPEPVYGNDTNPLDRRPERNGSGGTAMSREEAIRALGLSLGFGKAY